MSQPDQLGLSWPMSPATGMPGGAWGASVAPAADGGVRSAIARAAQSTGVDFSYLLAQARLESSLNPNARASTSSATGLYQFTNSTWLQTLQRHGDMLDGSSGGASTLSALSDPAARAQLLAMPHDPNASAMMAASLASDNQSALTGVLGRSPDSAELYLAHFLGSDGASKFLTAMAANPDQSAAALLPKAAASNRSIFFDTNGGARSLSQVMGLLRGKMDAALRAEGGADAADTAYYANIAAMTASAPTSGAPTNQPEAIGGPIAQQFAAARDQMGSGGTASTLSMAETLQSTFGGEGAAPDFVRNAYGRMKALGL